LVPRARTASGLSGCGVLHLEWPPSRQALAAAVKLAWFL